jgi:excisionase family DNA binding protein
MSAKRVLTTWEAGRYCNISPYTIRYWIRTGRLPAYTTPGGHRRIRRQDLDAFLLAHEMPLPQDFQAGKRRVMVLAKDSSHLEKEIRRWSEDIDTKAVACPFEAGLALLTFDPHVLLLDLDSPDWDGLAVCKRVRSLPETSHVILLAVTRKADVETFESAESCGVQHCLGRPVDKAELRRLLRQYLPSCSWRESTQD